ncbi:acireductone synthase [Streptomyces sp. WMMB 322]|uniref:acireductone synthase n=1 Tax=Streptomyces sp. WMMB 322 TaxID=1286821 RepID=UPI0006E12FEF|nr:acireductone synthase [Streptomyces sp. WMMB 322]SCK10766.1 acireductone synthase [Streptomyces sp. WMMB 322]
MTQRFEADSVLLDIEGTTSASRYVTEVLFPYCEGRLGALLAERAAEPEVRRAVDQVREMTGEPGADTARVEAVLAAWIREDRKATPLKTLQGLLWADAFARGDLVPHFYGDVPAALRRWSSSGVRLYVYSSGSVTAQRAWFSHGATGGTPLPPVDGFFDTGNAGPKHFPASYRTITDSLASPPGRTLFLSDRPGELDAAGAAGLLTAGVRRPGEPGYEAGTPGHPEVASFAELDVVRRAKDECDV